MTERNNDVAGEPAVEGASFSIEDKVDALIATALNVRRQLNRRTIWLVIAACIAAIALIIVAVSLSRITSIGTENRSNGNLLINCVTPGPDKPPTTGHNCWDRLHDPHNSDNAVAVIVDDLYCDQRRAQHHMPAVPDPSMTCRSQTDPSIYPGQ